MATALTSVFLSEQILKITAMVAAVYVFLSPLPMVKSIRRDGTTGDFSVIPFLAIFLNCCLWFLYSFLLETIYPIGVTNGLGAVFSAFYCIQFYLCSLDKDKTRRYAICTLSLLIMVIIYASSGVVDRQTTIDHVGIICCFVCVVMFASPLSTLATVIRRRSTESISFQLVVANCVCSFLWGCYGVITNDYFVMSPNAMGFAVGLAQLSLFAIYPSRSRMVIKPIVV